MRQRLPLVFLGTLLLVQFTCFGQTVRVSEDATFLKKDRVFVMNEKGKKILFTGIAVDSNYISDNVRYIWESELVDGIIVKYNVYFFNGNISESFKMQDGERHGKRYEYYESGTLKSESGFKDEELNGMQKSYYENGQLETSGTFLNGKPNGKVLVYQENGQISLKSEYLDGENSGIWKYYDADGNVYLTQDWDN